MDGGGAVEEYDGQLEVKKQKIQELEVSNPYTQLTLVLSIIVGHHYKILLDSSFTASCSKMRMACHRRLVVDSNEMCIT